MSLLERYKGKGKVKIIGKAITPLFLTVVLASCGSGTVTPVIKAADLTETSVSMVKTEIVGTQQSNATLTPISTSITETPTAVSTITPSLEPSPTGIPDKIAFDSGREDDAEIYVMNVDGSEQTNLTNNDCNDGWPAWSPDGTKIAFASFCGSDNDIYVMNANGSDQTNLTQGGGGDISPAWSPDSTRIAYANCSNDSSQSCEIYVMNADGSDPTRLTKNRCSDVTPTWSPDGAKIAFNSFCGQKFDIYVMDGDGSHQRRLINNNRNNRSPAWSPDGTRIAYDSCSSNDSASCEIYIISPDGSNPIQLTENSARDCCASWSSDGTRIAFVSARDAPLVKVQFDIWSHVGSDIYVMNADGSGQIRLTTSSGAYVNESPSWSPSTRSTAIQHPDCTSGWSRLKAGNQARVSQETSTPNRVRAGPSTADAVTALLHPGTVMKVIEGPVCADGLIFWKVENNSIPDGTGWTAEGDGAEYWLEPYVP